MRVTKENLKLDMMETLWVQNKPDKNITAYFDTYSLQNGAGWQLVLLLIGFLYLDREVTEVIQSCFQV